MRSLVVAGFCAAALAACGSTVQVASEDYLQSGLDAPTMGQPSQGVEASAAPDTQVVPGAGIAGADGPGTSGTTSGGAGQEDTTSTGPGRGTAQHPGNVPGVTATTVKFGVEYVSTDELAAYGDSAGVEAVGSTDMLAAYQAVVTAVNKAGGVAGGRKLVIVGRERSLSEDNAQAAQTTCAAFTEDDRVLAANLAYSNGSPGVPCLASKGVLSVAAGWPDAGSQRDFERFDGRYITPSTVETITGARTYVDALVRQGFLTPNSTVGLLWFDFAPYVEARRSGLLPALERHGITLKSEYQAHFGGSVSDLGSIATQMQNAQLRFRSDGVDRVITLDYQGTLQYFFMQSAESQEYRPKYGMASWSDAEFLRANSPEAQLAGSTGIGWMPYYDVPVHQHPVDASRRRCLAAMKAYGVPPIKAQGDAILQFRACGEVFFLAELLNTAADLSPAGLATTARSLGTQPSYVGFAERYGGDKLWGAAGYRDLVHDATCSCFAYRGPVHNF